MNTVQRCADCDRLAELPHRHSMAAGTTGAGEAFFIDVPLCVECQERRRSAGQTDEGEADQTGE